MNYLGASSTDLTSDTPVIGDEVYEAPIRFLLKRYGHTRTAAIANKALRDISKTTTRGAQVESNLITFVVTDAATVAA